MKIFLKKHKSIIFLILITIIGAFFRFYNLNWDDGHFFHPDERNIDMAVSRIQFLNQLNPGFFAYGGFLIYLYRLTGELLVLITKNYSWVYDWRSINIIGRFYSALFSTITIPLVFILSKKIFNKAVAYLSAILISFAVALIQAAHFSTTESSLIMLVIIICILSIITFHKPSLKNYIFCGVALGIATATKIIAVQFILFVIASQLLILFKHKHKFLEKNLFFLIFILTTLITFSVFSPYTFVDWTKFLESIKYESGVAMGFLPVVYTLQFDKTIPYLFQIKNLFWQIGTIAIFSIIGIIFLTIKMVVEKNSKLFIFLSFPIIYFIYVGYWHTKFIRYIDPLLPFFIMAASYILIKIKNNYKNIGLPLILSFLLMTVFWAMAFLSIYTKEQTRISASKWIYQNIPLGSRILTEHWDDGLPVPLLKGNPSIYNIEQLTIYDSDNQNKINFYAEKLSTANYIIINSRRLYGTLINLPEKYPITSRYYKLLFDGKLGYKKIAEFSSYPSLLGIKINDDKSEETFQVYDHPKVVIFINAKKMSKNQLIEAFIN